MRTTPITRIDGKTIRLVLDNLTHYEDVDGSPGQVDLHFGQTTIRVKGTSDLIASLLKTPGQDWQQLIDTRLGGPG